MSNPDATSDAETPTGASTDPVRVRRAQVAKWTLLANRVGYLFVALSIALFVIAFAIGFGPTMATLVIVAFVIGCVLLAPSIIVGYAVKAAEREDRERGF
jgi:heme/copper-type cytochrome/quinol oxidase subunit 3